MTAIRLSPVDVGHAAVLAALHGQCFEDAWSTRAMTEILASPGTFADVAHHTDDAGEEMPVGFALARKIGDDAELLTLCVLREHRRRGIGALLLDAAMRRSREIGARHLFLEVAETNDAARSLYAGRDFVAGRRRPDYYRGPNRVPVAALELRCDLAVAARRG